MTGAGGSPLHRFRTPRAFELRPAVQDRFAWSADPDRGVVQGPLDVQGLHGKLVDLVLDRRQVALFDHGGPLQCVLLSGLHMLDLFHPDALLRGARLHIVELERPLVLTWQRPLPVRGGARTAAGLFVVRIVEPCAFHAAFLRDGRACDEQALRTRLASLLPTFLAIRLTRCGDDLQDDARLTAAVASLDPRDLDADLAPYGLACDAVALQPPSGSLSEPLLPVGAGR
ncbi:MAG TPA: hypothetical protein P5571_10380 [Candidatus Krumholzibacteria bacterium]|nr:hypothetical protein [Candidatus Krumholzibacteria bacterium]HRX51760.1 hypothetical protein [Candidatus Krumholzibacteria bacterium]